MIEEKKIHYAPNYKIENGCLHEIKDTPKRVYELLLKRNIMAYEISLT